MHRKTRWILVPALVGLSFGLATLVGADESKAQLEEVKTRVIAHLGLSPQQKDALENNKKDHRERQRTLLKKLRDAMKAMRDELQKPTIDRQRIDALHAEMKGTTNALSDLRLEGILKIREILTPDQHKTMLEEFQKALPAPTTPVPDDKDPLLEEPGF